MSFVLPRLVSSILCFAMLLVMFASTPARVFEPQGDQARQALSEGRQLLKRGHADQEPGGQYERCGSREGPTIARDPRLRDLTANQREREE